MQIIHGARGRLTSRFQEDLGRGFLHRGIDIGHGDGEPDDLAVYAPADGKVVAAGRDGTYGNRLIIDHGDGWTSLLAHLAAYTVREGSQVHRGDLIATMGNTGTVFVHLHQELRDHGQWVDPELHLYTPDDDDELGDDDMSKIAELEAKLDTVLAGIADLQKVDHGDVHTLTDIADADTLTTVLDVKTRTINVEGKLDRVLTHLGIEYKL